MSRFSSYIPSAISATSLTKLTIQTVNKPSIKWLLILGTAGTCILIGIGCYLSYKRKSKPKQLRSTPLMRSGVWKSLQFGSIPAHNNPVEFPNLTSDQLFDNGVVSFQQAINSWKASCEMLAEQEAESEPDLDSQLSDSLTTLNSINIPNNTNLNHMRIRAVLIQADYLSQCIDRVLTNGNTGDDAFKFENNYSDVLDGDMERTTSSYNRLPFQDNISDSSDNTKTIEQLSDTDSFQSATLLSEIENGISPYKHKQNSIPRIILTTNTLYNEAMELAKNNGVFVRKYRTEMLKCENALDFVAKLHCIRSAFDYLVESQQNCLFFENQTTEMMTLFLSSANKDPNAFCREFTNMINFVKTPENIPTINKELNARNLKVVGFWDVAIDFALLDAFSDLENLPTPVTMVTQNRWLTPSLRESAITNAVWVVMQSKIKMLENKNGFMSRFYSLGETFMFTLAWGFLGTDEHLKDKCSVLKNGILSYLSDVFDLKVANYSCIETLADDILIIGKDRLAVLNSHL